jgi:hypothetical protein
VVADVDWERFHSVYNARGRRPLFDELWQEPAPSGNYPDPLKQLRTRPATERRERFVQIVREETAAILGQTRIEAVGLRTGFFELGMDSLMAVELKNRLARATGLSVRTAAMFDYPNAEALAGHLFALAGHLFDRLDVTQEVGGSASSSAALESNSSAALESKLTRLERLLETVY